MLDTVRNLKINRLYVFALNDAIIISRLQNFSYASWMWMFLDILLTDYW